MSKNTVLRKEQQAYQDALSQYQRQVNSYNTKSKNYNESYYRDASGNMYFYAPGSKINDGYWATFNGGAAFYVPRQYNPDQYFKIDSAGKTSAISPSALPANYSKDYVFVPTAENKDVRVLRPNLSGNIWATTPYEMNANPKDAPNKPNVYSSYGGDPNNAYQSKPDPFTKKFTEKPPDYTSAELGKIAQPSLIQQELNNSNGLVNSAFTSPFNSVFNTQPNKQFNF